MFILFPETTIEQLNLLKAIFSMVTHDGTGGELHQWLIDQGIDLPAQITKLEAALVLENAALNSKKFGKRDNQSWKLTLVPLQKIMRGIGQDLKVDNKADVTVLGEWGFNITENGRFIYPTTNDGWQTLGENIYTYWHSFSAGTAPNQKYLDSQNIVMGTFDSKMGDSNTFKTNAKQHYRDSKNENQQRDIKKADGIDAYHHIAEKLVVLHPENTLRVSDYGYDTNMAGASKVTQMTSVVPGEVSVVHNAVKDTSIVNENDLDLIINPGAKIPGKPIKFAMNSKMNVDTGMSEFRLSHADLLRTVKIRVTIWKKKKKTA